MNETSLILNNHIEIIKNKILLRHQNNIISIFLYGGYGRDEGSWVIEKSDEGIINVKPFNDYDIALIVDKKISRDEVLELEKELKKQIDIKWIDISQYTIDELKNFNTTIKNYDFKYASKWIYGDENILNHIPKMRVENISLLDVQILYATRIWTLIGSFSKDGLEKMNSENEMFFRNQMAKAILAIVDNILVVNKQYDPSYKKRVEKLDKFTDDKKLLELSKWALEEKLFPKSENMSKEEIESLYKDVNSLFFNYFYKTLSSYYGKNITKPEDIENYLKYSPKNFLKRMIKNYIYNDTQRELRMYLIILQGYIAFYYFDMNDKVFNKIKKIMSKYFSYQSDNINQIRLKVAELRTQI
jgi:hypothetical protein